MDNNEILYQNCCVPCETLYGDLPSKSSVHVKKKDE